MTPLPVQADDLYLLRIPRSVVISPDGRFTAWTVEHMDKDDVAYYTEIQVFDRDTKQTRTFTSGKRNDYSLSFSPSGKYLAYLSSIEKKQGLYVISIAGGNEKKIGDYDADLSALRWLPDESGLLFAMRYQDSHFITDKKLKERSPAYRHITKLSYKYDGYGFLPKDNYQVYTLDLESAELTQITSGAFDHTDPDLSRDGSMICYLSNRSKEAEAEWWKTGLYVMPLSTRSTRKNAGRPAKKERLLALSDGAKFLPRFSPDGKRIAFLGHDKPQEAWGVTNVHVWSVDVQGNRGGRDLTAKFDRNCIDDTICDLPAEHSEFLEWSSDGRQIFFVSGDDGTTNLFSVPSRGGKPTRIFGGDCHVKGMAIDRAGKSCAVISATLDSPGDIWIASTAYRADKKASQITNLNERLRKERRLAKYRDVRIGTKEGIEIHGWCALPPDFSPKKRYPSILMIHGGPRVQYGYSMMHEMQFLAGKGFVVLYTNPRGGTGKGELWAEANAGEWGDIDYKDLMTATDWLAKQSWINPKRIGVGGGSYGGFMTNWIVAQTNRFAAAVTMRSVVDLRSMTGSSDIGFSLKEEFSGLPWTEPEKYQHRSPLSHAKKIKTPLLILHNEQDLRCPIEQAEQLFVTLKLMKKTVEMVRFPDEPHGLSRHGRPDRRIARLEWIEKWFRRYLRKRGR